MGVDAREFPGGLLRLDPAFVYVEPSSSWPLPQAEVLPPAPCNLVSVLWLEKMLDMISILLNLLRFDVWPKMWSILENVPCALEKKVYSSAFGWNVLKISMRSISSNVLFKTCVSLLIFCFDDLSFGVSGALKSPTIIVLLSMSPFMSVSCLSYVVRCSYVDCMLLLLSHFSRVRLCATP